jgi:flagellar motor switch protein FliN
MDNDLNLPDLDHAAQPPGMGRDDVISARSPKTVADLEQVLDVPVNVTAVLGKTRMEVAQLLKIGPGQLLELDRRVGEAIDIYVNNRLVARGEVVVIEDKLGVTMTEIIKTDR